MLSKKKNCPRHGNCEECNANHADSQTETPAACDNARRQNAYKNLLLISVCLIIIQCLFLVIKQIVFRYTAETLYSRSMVTMISMMVLFASMIVICRRRQYSLSLFPKHFGVFYIVATVIFAAFCLFTLLVVKTLSVENALMLFYASLMTPIFEELLFRGVIWNRLNKIFPKEWQTYFTVTVLFALWHIGYAVGIYLWKGGNLLNCIVMKVTVGAFFGLITGAVRWKTKNCYCGILIHGILNAIG